MINTKIDRANLYLKLSEMDLITKIRPAIKDRDQYNVPWVYVEYLHDARCDIFHRVFHKTLGRIHSYCRSCWKVVIRPRNVVQLFDLYEFQRDLAKPAKCGYEPRQTVCGLWGGYFYNRSKEEALERYGQVKAFAETLKPEPSVIVKRYCTEFEIGPDSLGPSNELPDQTEKEKREEKEIDNLIWAGNPSFDRVQPDHIKAHIMRRWIHWAYAGGDLTYLELTNGEPLFASYVTYHQEYKNDGITKQ